MTRESRYVRDVTESTLAYVQSLIHELSAQRALIATLEAERTLLEAKVDQLRADIDRRGADLLAEYERIEQQNTHLANLYVASYRLHETVERDQLLAVIQEILANLVGSEEIGIFDVDPDRDTLSLLWSAGVDAERYRSISTRHGLIGRAVRTGEVVVVGDSGGVRVLPEEMHLTACVPLKLDGRVTGVITVFRLLTHKPALTRVDRELFDLLATHAATALYCTTLHARFSAEEDEVAP